MKRQSTIAVILTVAALLIFSAVNACGSRHHAAPIVQPGEGESGTLLQEQGASGEIWLSALKDASGAPMGVRINWSRANDATVEGYYIYRDSQPFSTPDPLKRVNNGDLVPQGPPEQPLMSFDDLFDPIVDATYYYRMTAADYDGDESGLSAQRSITIGSFVMSTFTPHMGPVASEVCINGRHFGTYNPVTDHILFSGVLDDKAPSTLHPGKVEAAIDPEDWTDRMITVKVPLGATVGPITLVVGGSPVDTTDDFNCTSPYITSVTPDPARSGDALDISGSNLGSHQLDNRLLLNGVPYATITQWNSTHVTATVPTGIPPDLYQVQLRVKLLMRIEDTNGAWIDIIGLPPVPHIEKVAPLYGEPGDTEITVTGTDFGSDSSIAELRINGASVSGTAFLSYGDTEITFALPGSVTRTGEVQLILHAAEDVVSNKCRYTANMPGGPGWADGVAAGFDLGRYSATAYDSTGKLHVLFTDNTVNNLNRSLFMAHQQTGNNFSFEALDPADDAQDYYVATAIDSSDHIYIAYQRQPSSSSDDRQVRFAYYDGSSWNYETVYSASGEVAGDYVDIALYNDPLSGIETYIAWRNATTGNIQLAYKLPGATTWTLENAFSPRLAEEIGYHLAIDTASIASGPLGKLGFSWSMLDVTNDQYYVEYGYSYDMKSFFRAWTDDGGYGTTKETDIEFDSANYPSVMYVTDQSVLWAQSPAWTIYTVLQEAGAGAGSRMKTNASGLPQIFGHRSGNQFYYAYQDAQSVWHVTNVPVGNSHALDASGRWDMAYDALTDNYALSFCDGTYRDARVFIHEGTTNSNVTLGDGFAEPGYDLTNQSVIVGSDGRTRVVFTDRDSTTGDKTLFFGKFVGGGGSPASALPFPESSQWSFATIASTDLDMLGRATTAVDGQDRYNIVYLGDFEWSDETGTHRERNVYFVRGDISGFSAPVAVSAVGGTDTYVPEIALGPSDGDLYALVYTSDADDLVLYNSDDGFQTFKQVWVVASEPGIAEYDVAAHHNREAAAVAYYSVQSSGIMLWESSDASTIMLPGTAGLDTGLSLMLDEDEHASVICADVSGTGEAKWVHWDSGSSSYVVDTLAPDASTSLTTSQAGTLLGPVATYYNASTGNHTLFLAFMEVPGYWSQLQVAEMFGASQPLRHSVDAYCYWAFAAALNSGSDYANNLVVLRAVGAASSP